MLNWSTQKYISFYSTGLSFKVLGTVAIYTVISNIKNQNHILTLIFFLKMQQWKLKS